MLRRTLAVIMLLAGASLAGCVTPPADDVTTANAVGNPADALLAFTPLTLIDEVRAGGEPVITVTPSGAILVSAHPGGTHTRYPPSPNLVAPLSGQSYLWRSEDNGATWTPIGLPVEAAGGAGPRGVGQGVSDPDFAVDANGRIYLTDLEALAAASVSWSDDDGKTWIMGNDLASTYGPVDRQWLAAHGTDVYFMGNYFVDERVLKSSDGGLTWSQVGSSPCSQDLIAHDYPDGTFALVVGCPTGIAVSTDDGATFERHDIEGASSWARAMTEPAVDAAGNTYITWANEEGVWLGVTPDRGATWREPIRVSAPLDASFETAGSHIWPWVVAGDAGRAAVVWFGIDDADGPGKAKGDWFVYQATVTGAASDSPEVFTVQATDSPVFQNRFCQSGTTCQADPDAETGDRRMGDFFEAAVDAEGYVHIAFSVALDDSISHPGYVRQMAGPRLYE